MIKNAFIYNNSIKQLKKYKILFFILLVFIILLSTFVQKTFSKEYKLLLFEYSKMNKKTINSNENNNDNYLYIRTCRVNPEGRLTASPQICLKKMINVYMPFHEKTDIYLWKLVFYDKRNKVFCWGEYYRPPNGSSKWKTIVIKKRPYKDEYFIDKEVDFSHGSLYSNGFTGLSDDCNLLLSSDGHLFNLARKTVKAICGSDESDYSSDSYYSSFHDNTVLYINDVYWTDVKGELCFQWTQVDTDNNKTLWTMEFGKMKRPSIFGDNQPKYITAGKSPDGNTYAFLNPESQKLYVSFLEISNKEIDKGIFIKDIPQQIGIIAISPIIQWSNKQSSNLLAEYDTYDIVSYGNKNRISKDYEVVIINTKKNEVVDRVKISYCVKSLRWTPDDKKLGILDTNSSLFIYDLDTKKLTKLMDCPDCFDFHFVK